MTSASCRLRLFLINCLSCLGPVWLFGLTGCGVAVSNGDGVSPAPEKENSQERDSEADDLGGSEWAEMYGGPARPTRPRALESSILQSIGPLRCVLDDRLTAAARHHAEALLLSPGAVDSGELDQLRFTLHRYGAYAYGIESAVVTLDSDSRQFLASLVSGSEKKWERCGLGATTVGERSLAVWVAVRPTPDIAPFPTRVRPGDTIRLRVTGGAGKAADSRLFVGRPDTTVARQMPSQRTPGGGVEFPILFEKKGRYEIELLYDTGHGMETVMLVPIFSGVNPDPRPVVAKEPRTEVEADPENTLLRLLNSARKRVGLAPLIRDRRLDRVARNHSSDMASAGYFGHVSPRFGNAAGRLTAAGLSPVRSGENIAGAATPFRVHRNLMASPAHRINMLNPAFTHVGIGTAKSDGLLLGTEVYAAW